MEKAQPWQSPRKLEELNQKYIARRFESYMQREDDGELTRELAIAALREELLPREPIDSPANLEALYGARN